MKNNILNMNKSNMIKACLLVLFTSMLPLATTSAQKWTPKPLYYQTSGAVIEVGDSVWIHPDSLYFETGERKAKFVYDKVHTVMQVGSKYHPDGVLLKEIYSWVLIGSIEPANFSKKDSLPEYGLHDAIIGDGTFNDAEPTPADSLGEGLNEEAIPAPADSLGDGVNKDAIPAPTDSLGQGAKNTPYQVNRFSVGLRGGFASTLQDAAGFPLGFDVALDLRYAHYWSGGKNKPELGIMTGLNVTYVHTKHATSIAEDYIVPTVAGDVRYTIDVDHVAEKTNQIQLEVPVMFSMVTKKGFFLNAGPKLMLPVYSRFNQQMKNPVINAYKSELNGHPITNNPVMGQLTDDQINMRGALNNQYKFSLELGAELGYEFKFNNGNSFGVGGYVDCTVFNAYKNQETSSLIVVTPPTNESKAIVEAHSLTNSMSHRLGLFDLGLKLSYNFNFEK
jgi:hypothetical protein